MAVLQKPFLLFGKNWKCRKMSVCKCELIWKNFEASLALGKTCPCQVDFLTFEKRLFFVNSSFAIINKTTSAPFHGCMSLWLKQKGFLFFLDYACPSQFSDLWSKLTFKQLSIYKEMGSNPL